MIGISGPLLRWLENILTGITVCVRIDGFYLNFVRSSKPKTKLKKKRSLTESFSASVVLAFTERSSSECLERMHAVFSEDLKAAKSWLLTAGSSVFTTETLAIKQAFDTVYKLDATPEEVVIFTDSKGGHPSDRYVKSSVQPQYL